MKNLTNPVKYLLSPILAGIGLVSWIALQSQAAPPVPESHSPFASLPSSNFPPTKSDPTTHAQVVETYGRLPYREQC